MITNYTKQEELINVYNVNDEINVIGCGALGSWIVFFLLKMGFKNIHVYDFDTIEEHNLPNQMFMECSIGNSKISGMDLIYSEFFNDDMKRVTFHDEKVTASMARGMSGILISAVDSMECRKMLFNVFKINKKLDLFLEGRLSIYGAYIYALTRNTDMNKYAETLYNDTEAEVSACGISQTALPAAVNAATIIIMQLIEYLNGSKLTNRLEYSIPWLEKMSSNWEV